MRSLRRRASALVFAVGVLFAASTVLLASAQIAMSTNDKVVREVRDADALATIEGVKNVLKARAANDQITVPSTITVTFGTKSIPVTISAGPNERWFTAVGSFDSRGKNFAFNENLPTMASPAPNYFTVYSNQNIDSLTNVVMVNGDQSSLHANGNVSLSPASRVEGDVFANGTISSFDVLGNKRAGAPTVAFPNFTKTDYAAGTLTTALGLVALLVPVVSSPTDPYPNFYVKGAPTVILPVIMGNRATVFVDGKLTLNASPYYASQASRWVWIVNGDLDVNCPNLQGIYIVRGNVNINTALTASKILIAAEGDVNINAATTITPDRTLFVTRREAVRHMIPGFYPTLNNSYVR